MPRSRMAGLCFLTPNAARSGTPQIPLLGTEVDTPLGERENFAGFPRTPRTGWWEGPRSGTSWASRSSMAHAWPRQGPGRPRRGAPSGHPQQSLNPPARPPRGLRTQLKIGSSVTPRPGRADLALRGDSPGAPATRGAGVGPSGRGEIAQPEPRSPEAGSGGAAWADAVHCDPRAEAYPASAPPAPRPSAPESPALLLTLRSREPGRDDATARALPPGQRSPRLRRRSSGAVAPPRRKRAASGRGGSARPGVAARRARRPAP